MALLVVGSEALLSTFKVVVLCPCPSAFVTGYLTINQKYPMLETLKTYMHCE